MKDLRQRLGGLNRTLARTGLVEGGRLVMFIAARRGEGVSSIAASSALLAAEKARRPAWLVDLDVAGNHLFNEFAVGPMSKVFGGVGEPYSACLRQQPFFSLQPPSDTPLDPSAFTAHRVGETHLMVTQFDAERIAPHQTLQIRSRPAYWTAVREATDWAVIDAPALEISAAGLAIAGQVDNCVIVTRADATPPGEVDDLRAQIEHHGGRVAGIVLNRMGKDALAADTLWRGGRD